MAFLPLLSSRLPRNRRDDFRPQRSAHAAATVAYADQGQVKEKWPASVRCRPPQRCRSRFATDSDEQANPSFFTRQLLIFPT